MDLNQANTGSQQANRQYTTASPRNDDYVLTLQGLMGGYRRTPNMYGPTTYDRERHELERLKEHIRHIERELKYKDKVADDLLNVMLRQVEQIIELSKAKVSEESPWKEVAEKRAERIKELEKQLMTQVVVMEVRK